MDPLREYLSPRSLADLEVEVIRRGGSLDAEAFVPKRRKGKKEKKP